MKEKYLRRLRIVRLAGAIMLVIGTVGIFWQYHAIAGCSTSQVGADCAVAMNTEGIGFALIFTGAVMILGSFIFSAFVKDESKNN